MEATIHIDMAATWELADQVTDAAAALSHASMQLRVRHYTPATDCYTLSLCRRANATKTHLAAFAESAAAELMRILQAILVYTDNAAVLSRRTELALMGLAVEPVPLLTVEPSDQPPQRNATREHIPTTDLEEHRILSEALLLHATAMSIAELDPRIIQRISTAARHLEEAARRLPTALPGTGDRAAAMLSAFAAWVRDDLLKSVAQLNDSLTNWATAYRTARESVAESAVHYQRWVAAAVGGANQQTPRLLEEAIRTRAAIDEYTRVGAGFEVVCPSHPGLNYSKTPHPTTVT